jgi:hypothetical protein
LEDGGEQSRQVKLRKCGELRRRGRVEKARLEWQWKALLVERDSGEVAQLVERHRNEKARLVLRPYNSKPQLVPKNNSKKAQCR